MSSRGNLDMTTSSPSIGRETGAELDWSRTSSSDLSGGRTRNLSDTERQGSLVAGAVLLGYGLIRRSLPTATLGAYLAYRGGTGRCDLYDALGVSSASGPAGLVTSLVETITVNRPRNEVYPFFRDLEDQLSSLRHLRREPANGDGEAARWYLGGSAPVRWELDVTEFRDQELISWTSVEGARLAIRYVIELEDAPRNRGTIVRLRVSYVPPGGGPGAALGRMFGGFASKRAREDLRRVKQFLEGGEIATTQGQPTGPSLRRRFGNLNWLTWPLRRAT